MIGRVAGDTVGDVGNAVWPVAQHVNDVVGVLRLAAVGEGESLEHDQGAGSADRDDAADLLAPESVAVDLDQLALQEGELQAGGDQGAEVVLERLHAAALLGARDGRHEEIDSDVELAESPTLGCGVTVVVDVGFEVLLAQTPGDLAVLLLVEQGDREANIEVGWSWKTQRWPRSS